LVAVGFCWKFMKYSAELTAHSVEAGRELEGLPLWDWAIPGLNRVVALISSQATPSWGVPLAIVLATSLLFRARLRQHSTDSAATKRTLLDIVNGVGILFLLGALLAGNWNPSNSEGTPIEWPTYTQSTVPMDASEAEELEGVLAELFQDTGVEEEAEADQADDLSELIESNRTAEPFPQWLAQIVLPLSFGLMALRYLLAAISGSFAAQESTPEGNPAPPKPPASTGKNGKDIVWAGLFPGILMGLGATLVFGKGGLIFATGLIMILMGAPLFLAIGVAALSCVVLLQGFTPDHVAKDMFEAVKKQELLAIPFFVLAGNIMTQGTIAKRLIGVARALMGRTPGGLGLATIAACVIFAAISGSSPVTVIAVGGIMFPMLVRDRYPENYSLGVLTSAGSLGIIIPPSVPMIVYAIMVSTKDNQLSPNDLFLAGVLPGLLIAGLLVFYTLYQTRPRVGAPEILLPEIEGSYGSNLAKELWISLPSLVLPILVLGGIYGLLGPLRFDVTEAAAIAVVYALFVELVVHRELKIKALPKIVSDAGVMMGSLFLIIVLALAFNKFLAERYIPQAAAEWLAGHVHSEWQFLILVNLFLLAIGCIMDILSAILIVAPLLAPIAYSFGIDPVHFGIIFIVNLELGYLTPPMGINLFVASTVFDRPLGSVIRSVIPFLLLMLVALIIISWVPALSTMLL
jgi:C4-dicarboxylate transporter DctM subunit